MAKFSVFISYQWAIKRQVEVMHANLVGMGLTVWRDDTQFKNTDTDWTQQIAEGIMNSKVILICLTQKYVQSDNCSKEIHYAFALKKPIVVLMIERLSMQACEGVGFLISPLLRINCYNDANNWHLTFAEEIYRAICQNSGDEPDLDQSNTSIDRTIAEVRDALGISAQDDYDTIMMKAEPMFANKDFKEAVNQVIFFCFFNYRTPDFFELTITLP